MEKAIDIGTIGVVVFCSMGVALLLEWLSLEMVLKLMPARAQAQTTAQKYPALISVARVAPPTTTRPTSTDRRAA